MAPPSRRRRRSAAGGDFNAAGGGVPPLAAISTRPAGPLAGGVPGGVQMQVCRNSPDGALIAARHHTLATPIVKGVAYKESSVKRMCTVTEPVRCRSFRVLE